MSGLHSHAGAWEREIKMNSLRNLNEVCEISNGYAFKSVDFKESGIPLLRISNIDDNKVSFKKGAVYIDESYLSSHTDFIVSKGDVVIALSGATTGKYGIYSLDKPALLNQRIGLIKGDNSSELDSRYFFFYLNLLKLDILRNAKGAAQPNISTKEIGRFKIPLPSLAEQQKIAAILDAADSLRQKDQQLIDHYTTLSQSLFLEMFGDPVTNPMGWEFSELSNNLLDIIGGTSVGGEERMLKKDEKGVLKISSVTTGVFDATQFKAVESNNLPANLVQPLKGDLLFSRANTRELVGAVSIVDDDYHSLFLPDKLWRLDLKLEKVSTWYIQFLLTHEGFRENLRKVATGTSGSMLNISKAKLKMIYIPLPPINLQSKFSTRIKAIESQKQQAQLSLEKSNDLFNSLLQRAFKGELTS